MRTPILWVEIPTSDFDRALKFYENVFKTSIEVRTFVNSRVGLFDKEQFGIGISINETENYVGQSGIKPFIFVNVIRDSLELVKENNGEIIMPATLLKQRNKNGDVIIGSNLIDNQMGYYAEIKDSEGNHLYLYSHS